MDIHTCVFMHVCDVSSCVHVLNACDTCSQYMLCMFIHALFVVRACADAIHMHGVSTNVMCVLMYVMYVMYVHACDTCMFVQ